MKEKIDRLETFVNNLKETGSSAGQSSTPTLVANDDNGNNSDRHPTKLTGTLRLSDSGTQYIGPTHWESVMEDLAEVKAYFDIESSPGTTPEDPSTHPTSHVTPVDIQFGLSQTYTRHELLLHLPPKTDIDRAVATWFNSADPLKLILHAPTFQQEYRRFWQNQNDVSTAWLAVLLAVAGVGTETSGQLRHDQTSLAQAEDFRRLTCHALVLADYTSTQPYIIEALMMHVKSLMLKGHEVDGQIWMLCGAFTRLSTRAGYHRDPTSNTNIAPLDAEMRRRVWMCVCEMDILISYQAGSVSIINQQKQDTSPPGNYLDTDFISDELPPPRSLEEPIPMAYAIVYCQRVSIYGDIIYSSHDLNSPSPGDLSILYDRLIQARKHMPRQFAMIPIDQSVLDSPELILDRYKLEFLHLKAVCILYRRYIGSSGHEKERTRCLDAAEETARLQIDILQASKPGGQLAGHLVLLQRHVHDLVIAAMLLCSEVKRELQQATLQPAVNRTSRIVPMLLRCCNSWRDIGVGNVKSRHALRAIELFLQRLPSQTATEALNSETSSLGNNPVSLEDLNPTMQNPSLSSNLQEPAASSISLNSHLDGFDFEHDPLFRDIFGPMYTTQDTFLTDWH